MAGTTSFQQIYPGSAFPGGSAQPPVMETSSGARSTAPNTASMYYILAMIGLLVAGRLAWEYAK